MEGRVAMTRCAWAATAFAAGLVLAYATNPLVAAQGEGPRRPQPPTRPVAPAAPIEESPLAGVPPAAVRPILDTWANAALPPIFQVGAQVMAVPSGDRYRIHAVHGAWVHVTAESAPSGDAMWLYVPGRDAMWRAAP